MKKWIRSNWLKCVPILILLLCVSIAFAQGEWQYKPPINNTGSIGAASYIWKNGYFNNLYLGNLSTGPLTGSYLRVATTTLTSAQVLALNTTPIAVVPTPGSGFLAQVLGCDLSYNPGTTPYTIGSAGVLSLKYAGSSGTVVTSTQSPTNLLDQSAKTTATLIPVAVAAGAYTLRVNVPIYLCMATTNVTAGNGTLTARVIYAVHPNP